MATKIAVAGVLATGLTLLVFSTPIFAMSKTYQNGLDGYQDCQDTYMIEYRVESNYGDAIYIECQTEDGREGGSEMKPLIRFDNLGLAGYTVAACTLQIYCYFSTGEDQPIEVHEALRNWKEFQTTCLVYANGLPWTDFACGCNDADASSSIVSSIVDTAGTGWKSFPLPVSLVQKWVDAPGDTNNGLLICTPPILSGDIKDRSFRSSDMFASSLRPKLIVHYDASCEGLSPEPLIMGIVDVPDDDGGVVDITWKRSAYDQAGSDPMVTRYTVWRRRVSGLPAMLGQALKTNGSGVRPAAADREGPLWEVVYRTKAVGNCYYTVRVPTLCDSSAVGTCPTAFYVSANAGFPGDAFNSPIAAGYSVNNLGGSPNTSSPGSRPQEEPDKTVGSTRLVVAGPNPAIGTCVFNFDLARPDNVSMGVYDASGRLIRRLVSDYAGAGTHSVVWDRRGEGGLGVAPGTYFVTLTTSREMQTRKFVLID